MKKAIISEALTNIEGCFLEEAAEYSPKRKKPVFIKIAAAAACFAAVLAIGIPVLRNRGESIELPKRSQDVTVQYRDPAVFAQSSNSLAYFYTEEELFTVFQTAVFKGTIKELANIQLDFNGEKEYRAIAKIQVESVYRGDCRVGDTVDVLLPCPVDTGVWVEDTDTVSAMRTGMTGIFMPIHYDDTSVWTQNDATLFLADVAPYGFADGVRYAFLETDDGLLFDRTSYASIADAQSLTQIEDYVIDMLEKTKE